MSATPGRPLAALSIDLDNLWSYLRAKGDASWQEYPSFLGLAVPRMLSLLDDCGLRTTVFIVGRDAEQATDGAAIATLLARGHEPGNHSYAHDARFHELDENVIDADLARTEAAVSALGGARLRGFRAPSFRLSQTALRVLVRRGYTYDASTFPNALGALARAWQRRSFGLDAPAAADLHGQYGGLAEARRPLAPYRWQLPQGTLIEIPVSTMPLLRLPVHWTYVNFLASGSPRLALAYLRTHIALCRARKLAPSLLLHATDFIGGDDAQCPHFMPGMRLHSAAKLALLRRALALYAEVFELVPLGELVDRDVGARELAVHDPAQSRLP